MAAEAGDEEVPAEALLERNYYWEDVCWFAVDTHNTRSAHARLLSHNRANQQPLCPEPDRGRSIERETPHQVHPRCVVVLQRSLRGKAPQEASLWVGIALSTCVWPGKYVIFALIF